MKLFEKKDPNGEIINISVYRRSEWKKLSDVQNSGYQIVIDDDDPDFFDDKRVMEIKNIIDNIDVSGLDSKTLDILNEINHVIVNSKKVVN